MVLDAAKAGKDIYCETATFLMSLVSQQERRVVRWDARNEAIV
jgi:hypothetical protein